MSFISNRFTPSGRSAALLCGLWLGGLWVTHSTAADAAPGGSSSAVSEPSTLARAPADAPSAKETLSAPAVCDPSAHPQPNRDLQEAPGQGGCPRGMVRGPGYCIDQYQASLELTAEDGTPSPWSPYVNPGREQVRAVSLALSVPQSNISQVQAKNACEAAGKRLCSDSEWLSACQGDAGNTYPYGPERQTGVCNDQRARHPAIEYYGTSDSWIWSKLANACINQLPDSLSRTGSHPGCVSQVGAFDMMGNLHEWTDNPSGVFRGGYYMDTVRNGPGCRYRTTAHGVGYSDYSTGFRCCADAPSG